MINKTCLKTKKKELINRRSIDQALHHTALRYMGNPGNGIPQYKNETSIQQLSLGLIAIDPHSSASASGSG